MENDKKFVTLVSVVAAIFLTGGKLAVGLMTGSLGLLAEAAHSSLDFVASVVTFFAVRVSDKPADQEHPYGHGKIENLSALLEAVLLFVACGWIVKEAVHRILHHVEIETNALAFGMVISSILIDLWRSSALRHVARKYNSQALEADALNFTADLYSSTVVLLGLCLVSYGKHVGKPETFERADAIAALVVTALLMTVTVRLAKRAVDVLMDRAPRGISQRVEAAARAVEGVLDIHDLRVRPSGNRTFVDLHVSVPRNLGFEASHRVAETVEAAVEGAVSNCDVVVHVDPRPEDEEDLADRVRAVAVNQGVYVHDLSFHSQDSHLHLALDLEVDGNLSLDEAHLVSQRLEQSLREEIPQVHQVHTHIESRLPEVEPAEALGTDSARLAEEVREVTRTVEGVMDCHEVDIGRSDNSEFIVSLHCTFANEATIEQVHRAASAVEKELKARFPAFRRVLVHTEPGSREAARAAE